MPITPPLTAAWRSLIVAASLLLQTVAATAAAPSEAIGETAAEASPESAREIEVPPLSIDTLYHPERRFDYVPQSPPATRWITDPQGRTQLLIRRPDGWKQLTPADVLSSGQAAETRQAAETDWPGVQSLTAQLRSIDGISERTAEQLVQRWLAAPDQSLQAALLAVDGGLVLAGWDQRPQWVVRQATTADGQPWEEVSLSPDAEKIAYIAGNNLHVRQIASGRTLTLTQDGADDRLNGRLDWVYQEELYGRGQFRGYWWSDDSRSLAFLRLDTSGVGKVAFADSIAAAHDITTPPGGATPPAGGVVDQRYPLAGTANPRAELWLAQWPAELTSGAVRPVFVPGRDCPESDALIVRVGWRPDSQELIFIHTNRLQNQLTLWSHDSRQGIRRSLLQESSAKWLETAELPHWLPDGDFLWRSDLPTGIRRIWRHRHDGSSRRPLTPADFSVRELAAVDPAGGWILVTGDRRRGTAGQQLYRASLNPPTDPIASDVAGTIAVSADTTAVSTEGPVLHQLTAGLPWHQLSISDDGGWAVDRCSSLTQPTSLQLLNLQADSTAAPTSLFAGSLRLPAAGDLPIEPTWVTITTDDGVPLPAYFYRPRVAAEGVASTGATAEGVATDGASAGIGPAGGVADDGVADNDVRFPVLIEIYGGPLAATVRDSWSSNRYLWHQMLVQRGIAVLVVDNRSSGGRGLVDSWRVHRRLGQQETEDLITAVDWLTAQPWVDADRLALRGWSFGGFLTLQAMTHSQRFRAGVAGGSVTDWRHYDTIYTERYMGLPSENQAGYQATSPLAKAADLHGRVLLLHGEIDDNVHLINTLQMAAALQKAGKPFDLMIYPGSAHGIQHGMPTYHLMQTVFEFLQRELQ